MIVVCHVGSARLAFRRGNGIEGSLSAVECAAPVPEEFAGAAVQRTRRPILVAFKSGQFAGHRPVEWYLLWRSVKLRPNGSVRCETSATVPVRPNEQTLVAVAGG